jgi:hypothetical protein
MGIVEAQLTSPTLTATKVKSKIIDFLHTMSPLSHGIEKHGGYGVQVRFTVTFSGVRLHAPPVRRSMINPGSQRTSKRLPNIVAPTLNLLAICFFVL